MRETESGTTPLFPSYVTHHASRITRYDAHATIATVFREEAGTLTGVLTRALGDFDLAEEAVQDALLIALERWPVEGIPRRPGAWLMTVARNRALDLLRRDRRYRAKLAEIELPEPRSDDRLLLMFTCCHPALGREAQLALTLRAVCGFTSAQIAHALLASEAAIAQRSARARRKIAQAGISFRLPNPDELDERLGEVLAVLYLMFNEGYLSSDEGDPYRRDLVEDATWLTTELMVLYPRESEPLGLLALMRLHLARAEARFQPDRGLILLADQDRTSWDRVAIAEAGALIQRAAALRRPGPYQLQAAIVACHAEAATYEQTDWPQVLALYDMLLALSPSPVTRLNRAIALRQVAGPDAALAELELLTDALDGYHLYHSFRGQLLLELGQRELARAAELRALALTRNRAEQALLRARIARVSP